MSALAIESLSASYSKTPVLREVSLTVAPGQVLAIIGPNGCGKSTLLRCACGLLTPQSGRVLLDGAEVATLNVRERARRVALLPQSFEGGHDLTVEEMVLLGRTPYLAPYGAPDARDREVMEWALQAVNAGPLRTRRIGELSGGERQRVLLARALAQQPRVLLLDEPTSNLDIRYQYELLNLARRLSRAEKLAVVLVLHQINLAAAVADTLLLLSPDGRTCAQGAPAEVMTQENLETVYQTPLSVASHPLTGRPQAQSTWVFDD
jgi:iron complex transport system ATP-binding protein